MSSKFFNDAYYSNHDLAMVGGVTGQDLNLMEREYMRIIDFNINISSEEYMLYRTKLLSHFQLM